MSERHSGFRRGVEPARCMQTEGRFFTSNQLANCGPGTPPGFHAPFRREAPSAAWMTPPHGRPPPGPLYLHTPTLSSFGDSRLLPLGAPCSPVGCARLATQNPSLWSTRLRCPAWAAPRPRGQWGEPLTQGVSVPHPRAALPF